MSRKDTSATSPSVEQSCSADAVLVQQVRQGDEQAGSRFVQEHYPLVYRYLLYLTGRPEAAEDLTQETFLRAWSRLETFDETAPLRPWLYRIAHRQFLQALRRQRSEPLLEQPDAVPEPPAAPWTEAIELRAALSRLPLEEREVIALHYLEGYEYAEIARILGVPVGRVRHRLSEARARLQRELGEGDLLYLNEPVAPMCQWAWLPLDQMHALESRLTRQRAGEREEEKMERREFLRYAAVGAAGMMLPETEKEVVDSRLTQKVTLALKGTALSDVCEHLRADTGVHLLAGNSVADEKVTLFCEKTPLREVMRQLSRPFGYAWLRSATLDARRSTLGSDKDRSGAGQAERRASSVERPTASSAEYRYELVQDLRSQLLEEELRNRDRNTALLALEWEIERYRPYLHLTPDEALARAERASPAEKKLLEALAGPGWGALQMYSRLAPNDLAALRAGRMVTFSADPLPGEQPLPPEVARGVLASLRDRRLIKNDKGGFGGAADLTDPRGLAAAAVPEARAHLRVWMPQSELGEFDLIGLAGVFIARDPPTGEKVFVSPSGALAVGRSPSIDKPQNRTANARFAGDPALRARISVQPVSSCRPAPDLNRPDGGGPEPRVTTADVLEAIHRATGVPIAADYYTRLFLAKDVAVQNLPLFDALNQMADAIRLRWTKDGDWLQFRSASYFHDRLKEVPNRLLERWATSRRAHGTLTLDDLSEIAQLSDAQLDATEMADGARECFGLAEWDLGRNFHLRVHLRYLAGFTPAQRQEAMSAAGLLFSRMTLTQQQQFMTFVLQFAKPLQSLDELAGATLRVDYSVPGWFQWGSVGGESYTRWVVPLEPGPRGRRVPRPPVRERTPEAALQALRRVDPQIRDALLQEMRRADPRVDAHPRADEAQIFPTDLNLKIIYIPGATNARQIQVITTLGEFRHGGG